MIMIQLQAYEARSQGCKMSLAIQSPLGRFVPLFVNIEKLIAKSPEIESLGECCEVCES